jgi:hypothetical protein
MQTKKKILLSFDIEEFDVPLEYGKQFSIGEQIASSRKGLEEILKILDPLEIKACFYCTVVFAQQNKEILREMVTNGHEIASHSYYHNSFFEGDLLKSKIELESICESAVYGFRKPQLQPVDGAELTKCGYKYNSSINPTFIPGRYNHLNISRKFFMEQELFQLPVSVCPIIRIPLFWLSFHNMPLSIFKVLSKWTINSDSYLHLYFHPWEFIDLNDKKIYNFQHYLSRNTGEKMILRFRNFINWCIKNQYCFSRTIDFVLENHEMMRSA